MSRPKSQPVRPIPGVEYSPRERRQRARAASDDPCWDQAGLHEELLERDAGRASPCPGAYTPRPREMHPECTCKAVRCYRPAGHEGRCFGDGCNEHEEWTWR